MRLRRVLELVDENVLDAAVERQQQIRRSVDLTQCAPRGERELHEVHFAPLREHDLELGGESQQHVAQRNEALPLQVAVAPFGQYEHVRQRLTERLVGAQAVDHCAAAIAQRRVLGAEPFRLRDAFTPLALLRQQQRGDSAPRGECEGPGVRRPVEREPRCELGSQRLGGEARRVAQ